MAYAKKQAPYHHGELREALIVAGRKLLEEKGWRGFTLRECARRAEVSHAAPAHHFASLDDLLAEIASRGYRELAAAMEVEGRRAGAEPAARLVGQCVGYMAFAAAHPMLFELMFHRDAERAQTPAFAAAVAAVIPQAPPEMKARMVDFAWSTVHGFIVLVLEGRIGAEDSSRSLKARGLAMLAAMVETVVRAGGVP
ncbi:MAG: TetR/AcrR family transcriptional regulator [Reyranellales bacterium]